MSSNEGGSPVKEGPVDARPSEEKPDRCEEMVQYSLQRCELTHIIFAETYITLDGNIRIFLYQYVYKSVLIFPSTIWYSAGLSPR